MTDQPENPAVHTTSTPRERALLVAVLVAFAGFTLTAVVIDGPKGVVDAITYNWMSVQIFIDLVLAIAIIAVWMYRDARKAGRNPWPWIVACPFVGVFSPLVYLITRPTAN